MNALIFFITVAWSRFVSCIRYGFVSFCCKFHVAIFVFVLFVIASCNKQPKQLLTDAEHCLQMIDDSMVRNPNFARKLIDSLIFATTDSLSHYKAQNFLIEYYIRNEFVDSACANILLLNKTLKHNVNNEYLPIRVSNYNNLGVLFSIKGQLDSALHYHIVALEFAEKGAVNKEYVDICINVADLHLRTGKYVDGIAYYRKALSTVENVQLDTALLFPIYSGLGQAYYMGLRNFSEADYFFTKAESFEKGRSLNERYIFYNNRANSFFYRNDYLQALHYFKKAEALIRALNLDFYNNLCYANLSDVYCRLDSLHLAKTLSDISYAYFDSIGSAFIRDYIQLVRSNIQLKLNNTKGASSILFSANDNDYSADPEIMGLRYQAMINYYKALPNFEKAFEYQAKSIALNDSIRSVRINNIFAETEMRYKQDTAMMHKEYIIADKEEEIKSLHWLIASWVALIVLMVVVIVFYFKQRQRKNQIERIKQNEAITLLRMQNIRNRISPHFIFNVLNHEISNNPEKKEILYLAKMLRRSLEMSESICVSLNDEIEFVNNYIELEKLKLGSDFVFTLNIDNEVDRQTKIPGMIIQIPVENAIKHALLPAKGQKCLTIAVTKQDSGVKIEIVDNGTGYKPELNIATKGTGTGLSVVYRTIALLNEKNTDKIEFIIRPVNLSQAAGTVVSINIPYNFNFNI